MKATILNTTSLALVAAAWITLTSCSSTSTSPPPQATTSAAYQEGVPGGVFVNTLDVSAKVTAIDQAKRKVTLQGADGKKLTVKVGPAAVNFDQIKVGDMVNATVTEQLVVYLEDESKSQRDASATLVALAPKGAQPGGLVAEATQVTGTVTAIDTRNRTATLHFEDGSTRTFPVRSDVDLSKRTVGERVVFRITEMVALSVEKP